MLVQGVQNILYFFVIVNVQNNLYFCTVLHVVHMVVGVGRDQYFRSWTCSSMPSPSILGASHHHHPSHHHDRHCCHQVIVIILTMMLWACTSMLSPSISGIWWELSLGWFGFQLVLTMYVGGWTVWRKYLRVGGKSASIQKTSTKKIAPGVKIDTE